MNEEMADELLWVLVEGPGLGDAEFLGAVLAAVTADQALKEQFKRNTALKDRILTIRPPGEICCVPNTCSTRTRIRLFLRFAFSCSPAPSIADDCGSHADESDCVSRVP